MYSVLVSDSSEYKKAKCVNENIVAKINQNEYKNALLNKQSLKHPMNITQIKNNRRGTYEINKIFLYCFDDKTYILDHRIDVLVLRY